MNKRAEGKKGEANHPLGPFPNRRYLDWCDRQRLATDVERRPSRNGEDGLELEGSGGGRVIHHPPTPELEQTKSNKTTEQALRKETMLKESSTVK